MKHVSRKPASYANDADLERHFASLKEADYQDTFEGTRLWLERAGRAQQVRHEPLTWRTFRYARNHRVRLALASLLVAFTIAACTIPVEQEETLGYTLSGTFRPDSSAMAVMNSVRDVEGVSGARWGTTRKEAGEEGQVAEWLTFFATLPDFSEDEAERQRQELEALDGVVSVEVRPMEVKVRRRLYQVALPSSLRPPVWRASARLRATTRPAEAERVVERYLNKLHFHEMDAKIMSDREGGQKLVVSSTTWGSLGGGFRRLEQLQRDMQPFFEEGEALGFVLSGKYLIANSVIMDQLDEPSPFPRIPPPKDPVKGTILDQIQKMPWIKHATFGLEDDWATFELRHPGVSRRQADVWVEELKAIDGIDEVDVSPIGQ